MAGCGIAFLRCSSSNDNHSSNHTDGGVVDGGAESSAPGNDAQTFDATWTDDGGTADAADAADAADVAPLPVLVCNQQPCARTEFCATVPSGRGPDDAGVVAVGAGDAGADDAGDGGTGDAGHAPDAATRVCKSAVFANLCDNTSGTVFGDQFTDDTASAAVLGAAFGSACQVPVSTPASGPTDPASGKPLTGIGNLCVMAGGAPWQPAVGYFAANSLSDVVLRGVYDDGGLFDLRFTQVVGPGSPQDLASNVFTGNPVTSDYFLVELIVDPASGSLCLGVIGMNGEGTTAGSYFLANQFLANGAFQTSAKSWYVYNWASATDGGPPSSADTFTLIASGP
jgi:hypothetical protein